MHIVGAVAAHGLRWIARHASAAGGRQVAGGAILRRRGHPRLIVAASPVPHVAHAGRSGFEPGKRFRLQVSPGSSLLSLPNPVLLGIQLSPMSGSGQKSTGEANAATFHPY